MNLEKKVGDIVIIKESYREATSDKLSDLENEYIEALNKRIGMKAVITHFHRDAERTPILHIENDHLILYRWYHQHQLMVMK